MVNLSAEIARVVEALDLGTPSARKGGRNPKFPYVPVIDNRRPDLPHGGSTTQIKGLAYESREEAVEAASQHIESVRARIARQLGERPFRALRVAHGLPAEIEQ
jgi:hypothetical protein